MRNVLLTSTCATALSILAALAMSVDVSSAQDSGANTQKDERPAAAPQKDMHPGASKATPSSEQPARAPGSAQTAPEQGQDRDATGKRNSSKADAEKSGESKTDRMKGGEAQTEKMKGGEAQTDKMKGGEAQTEKMKGEAQTEKMQGGDAQKEKMKAGEANRPDSVDKRGTHSAGRHDRLKLDQRQASELRGRLGKHREAAAIAAGTNIRVGAALPETIRPQEVPSDIIAEYPQFRGYGFVVVGNDIVVVDPRSREVVDVLGDEAGAPAMRRNSRLQFSREQHELIRKNVRKGSPTMVEFDEQAADRVPDTVVLHPLPEVVVSNMPDVNGYRYFVDRNDRIILVDPQSLDVVEIIN